MFFPTNLSLKERERFYLKLDKSSLQSIPFVHLRSDMQPWELEFFIERFQTKFFNCHPQTVHPFKYDLSPFFKMIYVENTSEFPPGQEINRFAGLCPDFFHLLKLYYLSQEKHQRALSLIKKFSHSCGHLSAFRHFSHFLPQRLKFILSSHKLIFCSEVDYLKNYQEYFPDILAIELENSLQKQIKIINYLSSKTWASKI